MLEVRKIDAGYGDVQVLFSLSLEVKEKEIVTLLGSNGAGKTTTLRCICGVVRPRQGEVLFKGRPVSKEPAAERAGMGIAFVPEGRDLWPQLTVRENLELGAYHGRARARARENLDRVQSLFPRLLERKSQMAGSLSGGEQQMRSEEHTSELQSRLHLVCRLLLEKKKKKRIQLRYRISTLNTDPTMTDATQ